ncbi:DNA polymerase III subunit delta [Ameyamaea chiangmaiensis NBRC 103196]|uniref:DNA-directed DNA polymerase n=1 Tax=Ameyamaea chiangmaiensis TaxID=442969 RepID=A0A850P9V6_9PROT|nr:DNA polymerase III subunit delta [Ameyamaea chiangmaiensis]MBS4074294.1 DNA polymerase III subunit delta [Ameyamaea chiangmaiensis]NVN40708.1 DNA polymerase III subunit delta [Ameyamaea chiangmaiensis]GBQ71540.1 DNA polymerase III subunit delta [Ameyamaea chiangmaiensis NBRC 103196]
MAKIDARALAGVLAKPEAWRAILLHGEDTGLIRERARAMATHVAGSLDDPFRVAILDADATDRLEEEALALSLTGGRRVVWVRDAGDPLAAPLKRLLDGTSEAFVVIEGGALPARSRLRALAEAHKDAASIACYPEEGRALAGSVRQMLEAEKIRITPDALDWLVGRLGTDRAATRSEVEKLALYAGPGGTLDIDDLRACIGDAGAVSLEDAAFAATVGDRASADLAIERALTEGTSPIAIARALLSHLHRLRRARLAMDEGQDKAAAMRGLRPPVFFKRTEAFGRALGLWSAAGLLEAARQVQALELACKQTGAPDQVLCRRLVAELCARARLRR